MKIRFIFVLPFLLLVTSCGNDGIGNPPKEFSYIGGGRVMAVPPDGYLLVRARSAAIAIRIVGASRDSVRLDIHSIQNDLYHRTDREIQLNLVNDGRIHDPIQIAGIHLAFYSHYKMSAFKEYEYEFIPELRITEEFLKSWLRYGDPPKPNK